MFSLRSNARRRHACRALSSFAVLAVTVVSQTGCGGADSAIESEDTRESEDALAGGSTTFPASVFGGADLAIGRLTYIGCTATLIGERTVLTAAHCVCTDEGPDADHSTCRTRETFRFPDNVHTMSGDVIVFPEFGQSKWLAYDYALIQLDDSYRTVISDPAVQPVPVAEETLSVGDDAILVGYGNRGDDCLTANDGNKRWVSLPIYEVNEDWHYRFQNPTKHICSGDSGGPLLRSIGGQLRVVGVASWQQGPGPSYYKSTYQVFDWIKETSAPDTLPQNTWGNCVYYPAYGNGQYYSTQGDAPSFSGQYAPYDNSTSQVWVKKGFEAVLYDGASYQTEIKRVNGFTGTSCNEFGCFYDLVGTGADNKASSATCRSALPAAPWGNCIGYNRFGDGASYATTGNVSSVSGGFNNKISSVWVRKGYHAGLYANAGYSDLRASFDGSTGLLCNANGCLHDLSGTLADDRTSSIQCEPQ